MEPALPQHLLLFYPNGSINNSLNKHERYEWPTCQLVMEAIARAKKCGHGSLRSKKCRCCILRVRTTRMTATTSIQSGHSLDRCDSRQPARPPCMTPNAKRIGWIKQAYFSTLSFSKQLRYSHA